MVSEHNHFKWNLLTYRVTKYNVKLDGDLSIIPKIWTDLQIAISMWCEKKKLVFFTY